MARQPTGRSVLKKAISQLKKVETAEELRQLQAVILPLEHGFSLQQTAAVLGVTPSWVNKIRRQFIKSCGKLSTNPKRGGRRYEKLTPEEEVVFLEPFFNTAQNGGVLVVKDIKRKLEERLNREISLTNIYNLLHRNGWNKVAAVNATSQDSREIVTGEVNAKTGAEIQGGTTNPGRYTWRYNPYAKQVNIINIDSVIPNFALAKVDKYFGSRGYTVNSNPDLVGKMPSYISVVFEANRDKAQKYEGMPDVVIGGTGWDIKGKLPAEIEAVKPKINLGYASRGCNRNCSFCVVPVKEGNVHPEADLFDVWDGQARKVILLDNNILQLPDHFRLICTQAQQAGIILDWNQGLDIRLVNAEVASLLENTRMEDIRFALDSNALIPVFRKKLKLLRQFKVRKDPLVYLLTGFDSSWDEDMERVLFLKGQGCRPYIMKHTNVKNEQRYTIMQEWVNQFWTLHKYTYEEFAKVRKERYLTRRVAESAAEKG